MNLFVLQFSFIYEFKFYRMHRLAFLFAVLILFCLSCEEKQNPPSKKGNVTLSSEILGTTVYYVNGYSFEEEKYVSSLSSGGGDVADVIPENLLNVDGEVIAMVLSPGPGNPFGFYKNFESSDLEEARDFYLNYLEVDVGEFSASTSQLKAGQVYTFRTLKENYVKILVRDVRYMISGSFSDYIEADISYSIQRDGSTTFEE